MVITNILGKSQVMELRLPCELVGLDEDGADTHVLAHSTQRRLHGFSRTQNGHAGDLFSSVALSHVVLPLWSLYSAVLKGQERQRVFNKQPHQSFGVENEFVPASLLVPDDGVHASYLWCALEDTQCLGKGMALVSRGQRGPDAEFTLFQLAVNMLHNQVNGYCVPTPWRGKKNSEDA